MALVAINLAGQTRIGNMTSFGNLTAAFDGTTNAAGSGSAVLSYNNTGEGYVGTLLATPEVIGQVKAYGTNNNGFVATYNSTTSLQIYGKLGSNPANGTDGTLIASLSITDTANESAGRTFTVTDTNAYDRVWIRITHGDTTSRACGVAELQLWEVVPTGDLVTAETGDDTAAFDGDVVVTGNLAAAEIGNDTASFTGTLGSVGATGDMAATETGSDTAAFDADVIVTGNLVIFESGDDTLAFTGKVIVSGSLAVTEVGADVAAFIGSVPISAALVATESGPDLAAFSGTVAVGGTLAATEIGTDTAAFTGVLGTLPNNANMAAQETGTDTVAFSGKVTIVGDLAAAETGVDTAAFTGKVKVVADFAVSEIGVDLAAFSGTVPVRGSLVTAELGADTADFSGVVPVSGIFDALEVGDDTAAFDGSVGSIVVDFNAVETGEDTATIFISTVNVLAKPIFPLLTNASAGGSWVTVAGGGYVWSMTCTDFNSAIAILQAKGPDGATPMRVAITTANSQIPINIADATDMRVIVSGRIYGGFSDLSAFDSRQYGKTLTVPAGCEVAQKKAHGLMVTIRPSKVDPRTRDVGYASVKGFGDHGIGFPDNPNGEVWIQFNGTGGKPYIPSQKRFLTEVWVDEIMEQGYTVIELAYDNETEVNEDCCGLPEGRLVDNCAGNLRREVITGEDLSPFRTVDEFNSVNYRVKSLLDYVANYNLPVPDIRPFDWSKVYISGHSQGGGHTYYVAKHWGCKYATFLGSPYDVSDDIPVVRPPAENIADWYFDAYNMTPINRMGAFLTTADPHYTAFVGAYGIIGLVKDQDWFNVTKQYYLDNRGKPINGHAASILDPSLKEYRAKASFDRIALLSAVKDNTMGATPIYQPKTGEGTGGTGTLDPELAALAGLESAPDKLPFFTGIGTASLTPYTSFARLFDASVDVNDAYDILQLGTAAFANTGTNGHNVPFLDATSTVWSGSASFTGSLDAASLDINSGTPAISAVYFKTNDLNRWTIGKWDTALDDLLLAGYNDAGARIPVFTAVRSTGVLTFAVSPFGPTPALHDNTLKLATTQYVMSEIASYPFTIASVPGLQGALDNKQNLDATLTALANLNTTLGLVEQTGIDTFTKRLIGVTNGSDIPTRALADARYAPIVHTHLISDVTNLQPALNAKQDSNTTLTGLSILIGSAGLVEQTSPSTFVIRDIGVANATSILTRADGDARYTAGTVHTHPISDIVGLQSALDAKQPLDATLNALAALDSSVGALEQTGPDTFVKRSIGIGFTTSLLTRADGDLRYATAAHTHVMANITDLAGALTLKQAADPTLSGLAVLDTVLGLVEQTGTDIFTKRNIGVGTGNSIPTTALADARYATAAAVATKQNSDTGLTGLTLMPTTAGVVEQTTPDTFVIRTIGTSPSTALLTVGDADARFQSVALDPTLVALAGLDSVAGLVEQTAADTFTKRLIGVTNASDILTRSLADTRYATAASVTNLQPLDTTLTGLALLDTTSGMVEQNGATSFTKRALGVGASTSILTRADGDGRYLTSTTIDNLQPLDSTLTGLAALVPGAGLVEQTTTDTFVMRLIGVGAGTSIPTRSDADTRYAASTHSHNTAQITDLQPLLDAKQFADPTLSGLALLDSALGLVEQIGVDQYTKRLIGITNGSDIPTKAMIDARYSLLGHIHPISEVAGLQTALDTKQASDPTLVGLASMPATAGLVTQGAADTFTITGIGVSPTSSIPTTALADARYAANTHTHVMANITDLAAAMALKQDKENTLVGLAALTGTAGLVEMTSTDVFQTRAIGTAAGTSVPTLANADARYAPIAHTQSIATITNLQSTLDAKQLADPTLSGLALLDGTSGLVEQTGTDVFTKRLIGVTNGSDIPTTALADARYAGIVHGHAIADITNLQTTLNAKQTQDNTLTGLSSLDSVNGLVEQTAPDVFAKRLIGVTNTTDIPTRGLADARYAQLAGASFTGGVLFATAPTYTGTDIAPGTSSGVLATTKFVSTAIAGATTGGVPAGGTTNQILTKLSSTNYDMGWVNPAGVGTFLALTGGIMTGPITLPVADPTNGLYATHKNYVDTADALKANLASPTFTGTVAVPNVTYPDGSGTTKVANTKYVFDAIATTQPLDATLTAFAGFDSDGVLGLVERTGTNTFGKRAIGIATGASLPTFTETEARYAPKIHTHVMADVTDLAAAMALKQPKDATLDALAALTTTLGLVEQTGIDQFNKRLIGITQPTSIPTLNDTDGRYATIIHGHAIADVSGLQTVLNAKQLGDTTLTGLAAMPATLGLVTQSVSPDTFSITLIGVTNASDIPTRADGDLRWGTLQAHTHPIDDITGLQDELDLLQPGDNTLYALSSLTAGAGVIEQTTPDAFVIRSIGVALTTSLLTRADGDFRYPAKIHTHVMADITDLAAAMNLKQDKDTTLSGLAVIPATVGLVKQTGTDVFGIVLTGTAAGTSIPTYADTEARYSVIGHTHTTAQITNLDTTLANKQPLDGALTAIAAFTNTTLGLVEQVAGTDQFQKRLIGTTTGASIPTYADTELRYLTSASIAGKQDGDPTLTALAAMPATVGLVKQTAADVFGIVLTGTAAGSSIPTYADTEGRYSVLGHTHTTAQVIGLDTALTGKQAAEPTLTGLAAMPATAGLVTQGPADTFTITVVGVATGSQIPTTGLADLRYSLVGHTHLMVDITDLAAAMNNKQAADPTLSGLALLDAATGLVEQTATDTFAKHAMGLVSASDILRRSDGDIRYAQLAVANTFASNIAVTGSITSTGSSIISRNGYLQIDRVTDGAGGYIYIDVDSGQPAYIQYRTGTTNPTRWALGKTGTIESSTATGSDFTLLAYDNAGSSLGSAFTIIRSSQVVAFTRIPTAPTATAGDSSTQLATTAFVTTAVGGVTGSFQPLDPQLTALASPTPNAAAADRVPFYTSATTSDTAAFTSTGRSLVGAASIAAVQTLLTLGTAAYAATGTSAHTIPYLDGINTWSGANTWTALKTVTLSAVNAAATVLWLRNATTGAAGTEVIIDMTPSTNAINVRSSQVVAYAISNSQAGIKLRTSNANLPVDVLTLTHVGGVFVGNATGGDKGINTFNANTIYEAGTSLSAKYAALSGAAFTGAVSTTSTLTTTGVITSGSNIVTNGYLMIDPVGVSASLYMDVDTTGLTSYMYFRTGGVNKFHLGKSSVESFALTAWDDTPAQRVVFSVTRPILGTDNPVLAFSYTPTAPTATLGDSSTQLATTAFVTAAITNAGGGRYTFTVSAAAQTIPIGAYVWKVTAGTFTGTATLSLTGTGITSGTVTLNKGPDVYPSIVYITNANTSVSVTIIPGTGNVTGWTSILQEI